MQTSPSGFSFQSGAATHVGHVRENNEDAHMCRDDVGIWAVADGLGGHEAGELASKLVVDVLSRVEGDSLDALMSRVERELKLANAELLQYSRPFGPARTPGSTVAVLLAHSGHCAVSWAGDSRVYRIRNGESQLLTHDHSHVQGLLDEGLIAPGEEDTHPMAHAITRAVGIDQELKLESARISHAPGDRFVLCTDGLSRLLSAGEICAFGGSGTASAGAAALVAEALERGAPDNVTVVCVDALQ